MKLGILSDTHVTKDFDKHELFLLINQLKEAFKDADEIVHAGDISEDFFLNQIKEIAPVRCVRGNLDTIKGLREFTKFTVSCYNIGIKHILPENLEEFAKNHDLNILIFGHTHVPIIKGTNFNLLLLNPGSPTKPKAPIERPGFLKPKARPSVMTLSIDKDDILSTFIVNLKLD